MTSPAKKPNPLDALPDVHVAKQRSVGHPARGASAPASVERIIRGSLHLPHSLDARFRELVTRLSANQHADKSKVLRALIEEVLQDDELATRVARRLQEG